MPNTARAMKTALASPTAPIASGPSRLFYVRDADGGTGDAAPAPATRDALAARRATVSAETAEGRARRGGRRAAAGPCGVHREAVRHRRNPRLAPRASHARPRRR